MLYYVGMLDDSTRRDLEPATLENRPKAFGMYDGGATRGTRMAKRA
jgi:hypothetical protein